jgi:uncharacterized delta-60 repeat protein
MFVSRLALSITLLLAAADYAAACPSDFDQFGSNGRSEMPAGLKGNGFDVAVAPSGSIYVAATVDGEPAILRYTSGGQFDASFGEEGVAGLNVEGRFDRLALLGDGSIVAAGSVQLPEANGFVWGTVLSKFDSTGQLDESFGDDGTTLIRFGDSSTPSDMLVRSDGVIVVVGAALSGDIWKATLYFFTAGGDLSAALGAARALPLASAVANAVVEVANKGIVIAGTDVTGDGGTTFLVRYSGIGAIDTSFGNNGFRRIPSAKVIEEASSLDVDSNGRLYLSGTAVPPDRPRRMRVNVRRFSAGGARDDSYGRRGQARVRPGGRWTARDIDVSDDGVATVPATRSRVGSILVRFDEDGEVDRAFGHLGIEGVLTEHIEAIDVPSSGKIVAAGSFSPSVDKPIVLRFEGGEWDGTEACVEDCGNGDVERLEECDDGNVTNGDGCSAACLDE